jgi:hypothetical protein
MYYGKGASSWLRVYCVTTPASTPLDAHRNQQLINFALPIE